jgi:hypothetical protein
MNLSLLGYHICFNYWHYLSLASSCESGGAGEPPPHAPTDPCVNLSIHTAPASLPLGTSRSKAYAKRTRFLPVSWLTIACCELAHPLRSIPITGTSSLLRDDPPLCFASVLSFSWDLHLNFSLTIETTGSHVPRKSLTQSHAIFTPEAA